MSQPASPAESRAFMKALDEVKPDAPTACAEWTAHDLIAHLAAGAQEIAELIEDTIAGRPPRPTRSFDERAAPFAALPDDHLRHAMVEVIARKIVATRALAERGTDATFEFTGRLFTAAQPETHSRSEAELHRWDLVGDDEEGDALLAQPELTRHAVNALNTLPVLSEAPAASGGSGRPVRRTGGLAQSWSTRCRAGRFRRHAPVRASAGRLGRRRRDRDHRRRQSAPHPVGPPLHSPGRHYHRRPSSLVDGSQQRSGRRGALAVRRRTVRPAPS